MSDVTLSGSTLRLLSAFRQTADATLATQRRFNTGVKVNAAVDDPSTYIASKGLAARAGELATLLEGIGQATKTLEAADKGMTAIAKLADIATAQVAEARASDDPFKRAALTASYNKTLAEIESIAGESGYLDRNLLGGAGGDLKLYFDTAGPDALTVPAIDLTDASTLGLERVPEGALSRKEIPLANAGGTLGENSPVASADGVVAAGATLAFSNSGGNPLRSVTVTAGMTVKEFVAAVNDVSPSLRASFRNGILTIEAADPVSVTGGAAGGPLDAASFAAVSSGFASNAGIDATATATRAGRDQLRDHAAVLGSNLAIVKNRESFTKLLSDTLLGGSENLVAADVNEEAATLLALDARGKFATTALSLTAGADKNILRLLG
jgi:flagellin-like hook-associated protein FlgL